MELIDRIKSMLSEKAGRLKLGEGIVMSLIMIVILAVVLLNVATDILPTGVEATYNLTAELATETTFLGTQPAGFLNTFVGLQGWFWVIAIVGMVIAVPLGIAALVRGRRGR